MKSYAGYLQKCDKDKYLVCNHFVLKICYNQEVAIAMKRVKSKCIVLHTMLIIMHCVNDQVLDR